MPFSCFALPVQSLGQKDPLEKGTATHSSILAWRIPWTEEPGGPQSRGSQRVKHDQATNPLCLIPNRNNLKFIVIINMQSLRRGASESVLTEIE